MIKRYYIFILTIFLFSACQSTPVEELAHQALEEENFDQAITLFGHAIRRAPEQADLYYWRGTAYYGRYSVAYEDDPSQADGQDFEHAIEDFSAAIYLDETYAEAYSYRGLVYAAYERFDEALADYNRAIELAPALASTYYARAYLYESTGQTALAIEDYEKYLEIGEDQYWLSEARQRLDALLK